MSSGTRIPGQFRAILRVKLRMAGHYVASVRNESKLKVGVLTASVILLWLGAYAISLWGFEQLLDFGGTAGAFSFGGLLTRHVLALGAMTVFFLLILSNLLVAFSTLYKAHDAVYLLQGPLRFQHYYHARLIECVIFSSWALAYLGSPLLLAYVRATEAGAGAYAAAMLLFLPYITIPACIGSVLCMVLARVFPALSKRVLGGLGIAAVGAFYFYLRGRFASGGEGEISIAGFAAAIERTQSPYLPSQWAAQSFFAAAAGDYGAALLHGLTLLSTALFFLLAAGWIAERHFYAGWSALAAHEGPQSGGRRGGPLSVLPPLLFAWLPNPMRVLCIKDFRLFWRDPVQWPQFIIFFGIMAVYIANLGQQYSSFNQPAWRGWVACLNLGALSLILSTLTSRFVYPLVSLEGRRFWILRLGPLTHRQLLWQKFWSSIFTTAGFTIGLAVLSAVRLQLGAVEFALTALAITASNFGLAGLAVGLGALYPNFQEDNPARIVSGMGGTLNLLLSVAYVAVVCVLAAAVIQSKALGLLEETHRVWVFTASSAAAILALSAVCAIVPMRLGLRNLNRMEF